MRRFRIMIHEWYGVYITFIFCKVIQTNNLRTYSLTRLCNTEVYRRQCLYGNKSHAIETNVDLQTPGLSKKILLKQYQHRYYGIGRRSPRYTGRANFSSTIIRGSRTRLEEAGQLGLVVLG